MSSNAQRFAAEVIAAFKRAGLHSQQEVRDAGGPSTTTQTQLVKVARGELDIDLPRGDVLRKIEDAAKWKRGSARALFESGAEPVPVGGGDQDVTYVSAPGSRVEGGITPEDLMREIVRSRSEYDQQLAALREELRRELRDAVQPLSERVARIEGGTEPVDGPGGAS